ncbi:MAG: putative GTP-binding protein EngB [Syntrophaceae bacterium PtaU1.Bin231]|nr:MAG: putative GTP-binding protein EngB [Syntrophaceae bacterium PtaU1.Bin231]
MPPERTRGEMKVTSARFVKSAVAPAHYPEERLPEVAFAGKSNVGKSSLINALANRRGLAQTSSTPGRTRLINFFTLNDRISFVDLPGYGFARVPAELKKSWGPMVEAYLRNRRVLRLVVVILDVRREPSEGDLSLLGWLSHHGLSHIVVLTKIDKVSMNELTKRKKSVREMLGIEDDRIFPFSAVTRQGKDRIWNAITASVSGEAWIEK